MKSKGCSHVPFGPAGERPIFLNCSATQAAARSPSGVPERRPLRSSEARKATSAFTRAAAGESAGAGAGCARSAGGKGEERERGGDAERLHPAIFTTEFAAPAIEQPHSGRRGRGAALSLR